MARKLVETETASVPAVKRTGQSHRNRHGLRGVLVELTEEQHELATRLAALTPPTDGSRRSLAKFAAEAIAERINRRLAEMGTTKEKLLGGEKS